MQSIVPNVSILAQSVDIMPGKTGDMHSYPFKSLSTNNKTFPPFAHSTKSNITAKENGNRKG